MNPGEGFRLSQPSVLFVVKIFSVEFIYRGAIFRGGHVGKPKESWETLSVANTKKPREIGGHRNWETPG